MPSLQHSDLVTKIYSESEPVIADIDRSNYGVDCFDRLPDSLFLIILNKISDVKALGRCCLVSRRFQTLVAQVENVVVRVDCVISDDDSTCSSSSDRSRSSFSSLFRLVFGGIVKPFQALGQFLGPIRVPSCGLASVTSSSSALAVGNEDLGGEFGRGGVTHHSPTQVLKNFNHIRFLRIDLPGRELGIEDGVLLKWRADFGSTLDNCVILGASSVIKSTPLKPSRSQDNGPDDAVYASHGGTGDDIGSIPESFYTNGGLKLRVVWMISSLIAASALHYLLHPIIAEHKSLDNLVLSDGDGQGVLCMNRDQLEELRVKPLSASSASKRTLVPALNMRLWYAPHLELPDGHVLKGATLVAIRPTSQSKEVSNASCLSTAAAFKEPYGTAAEILLKGRTYSLEMNSF